MADFFVARDEDGFVFAQFGFAGHEHGAVVDVGRGGVAGEEFGVVSPWGMESDLACPVPQCPISSQLAPQLLCSSHIVLESLEKSWNSTLALPGQDVDEGPGRGQNPLPRPEAGDYPPPQPQLSRKPMSSFSSLRARLVGTVFLAIAPAWVIMYFFAKYTGTEFPWPGFVVGLLALVAAWLGGEHFILRQVRVLSSAAQKLGAGDLSSRTGLVREKSELGELARTFDAMAVSLQQRVQEREQAEKTLLNRSFQQTVVSALGQFALVSNDFSALLNQAALFAAQTLEVEYCHILELTARPKELAAARRRGLERRDERQDHRARGHGTQAGFTLSAGEPVVVEDLPSETRFRGSPLLVEHGVVSGMTVAISGHGQAFGVLGAHTTHRRKFTEDEVHFLLAVATVLAMAVARNRAEAKMEKLAAFAQLNPNPAMELAADGTITYFNDAALNLAIVDGTGPSARPSSRQHPRHRARLPGHRPKPAAPRNPDGRSHAFLVLPPGPGQPGRPCLRRGHHRAGSAWKPNCANRKKWSRSANWPRAWRTISTTC